MYNKSADNELCQPRLQKLTTALHEKQFTTIGLNQTLNKFIAPRANRFYINHYDHSTTRYMENTDIEDDTNTSPKLTENDFITSEHVFKIDSTIQKMIILSPQH